MKIFPRQILAVAALLLPCAVAGPARAANAPARKSPPAAKSSLDEELLKSLGDPRPEGLDEPQTKKPATGKSATDKPAPGKPAAQSSGQQGAALRKARRSADPLDRQLRQSLGGDDGGSDLGEAGEDIGDNRLTKIVDQMKRVEKRLAASNSDQDTRKQQQQIAAELAALIDELNRQQASKSQSGKNRQTAASGAKAGRPGKSPGNSAAANSEKHPARNSGNALRRPLANTPIRSPCGF